MSPAVATFNDAFDFDEPARKRALRKPRAGGQKSARGKGKKKPRRFAVNSQRVARYGAIGMSATIALAIMVNALMLQKGRHPAPLFGKSIALGATPVPAARPAPVQRTAAADDETVTPAPSHAVTPPPVPRQAVEDEPETRSSDAIGALIDGRAPTPTTPKGETKTVLAAQRALAKLGFALKPNGTLGPQTRKAIEAFERDHHLPVKGELSHRVVKLLETESKLRID